MSLRYEPVEVLLTLDELTALCAEWQERLRLQDWMVHIRLARAHEIPNLGGYCEYLNCQKIARIAVLDHVDWTTSEWTVHDMEEILVHELLHLQHSNHTYEKGTLQYEALEIAIDTTAQALVQLKREAQKPKEDA